MTPRRPVPAPLTGEPTTISCRLQLNPNMKPKRTDTKQMQPIREISLVGTGQDNCGQVRLNVGAQVQAGHSLSVCPRKAPKIE
eukprot:9902599-Karenia_brevis.AAC.1